MINEMKYHEYIDDLINSKKVQEMKKYRHHANTSCYEHSIHVMAIAGKIAKYFHMDVRSTVRGALLHDLFLYDWKENERQKGERMHGFTHPKKAFIQASSFTDLSDKESDIVLKHMWPLTIAPPSYRESWLVCFVDKYCASEEFFRQFKLYRRLRGLH